MKSQVVALAFAGLAFALEPAAQFYAGLFTLPDGIDLADNPYPVSGPPASRTNLWHPAHPEVDIDGCDDHVDTWHWANDATPPPHKPDHKPDQKPGQKWTTSTITATSTKTVISCAPTVHECPGPKTVFTTITIPKTTTICPVPIPTGAPPPAPPKTTSLTAPPPAKTTAPAPAPIPPKTTAPALPPATTVGTVTRPAPAPTTSRAVVTAGAVQNVQRAGGALAAVAMAAAALI